MTPTEIAIYFVAPAIGYLLGSIPFAWLIGRSHGVDIRTVGSKNIGATNLGRTLGKKFFWQAFLLDAAKGFVPVLVVTLIAREWKTGLFVLDHDYYRGVPFPSWVPLLTAVACVLGHNYPIFLKFRGGKGVATSFGAVLGFWPLFTLAAIGGGVVFVVVLMIHRFISLASIVGALAFVFLVATLGHWDNRYLPTYMEPRDLWLLVGIAGLFAAMIIIRHRANIGRLMKGTEPQIGQRERDKANFK
jgi:glycerol-3-phosphate acyltransferase PlsY